VRLSSPLLKLRGGGEIKRLCRGSSLLLESRSDDAEWLVGASPTSYAAAAAAAFARFRPNPIIKPFVRTVACRFRDMMILVRTTISTPEYKLRGKMTSGRFEGLRTSKRGLMMAVIFFHASWMDGR